MSSDGEPECPGAQMILRVVSSIALFAPRAARSTLPLTQAHTHTALLPLFSPQLFKRMALWRLTTRKGTDRHLLHRSAATDRRGPDSCELPLVQIFAGASHTDKKEVARLRHRSQELLVRAHKGLQGTLVHAFPRQRQLLVKEGDRENRFLELRDSRQGKLGVVRSHARRYGPQTSDDKVADRPTCCFFTITLPYHLPFSCHYNLGRECGETARPATYTVGSYSVSCSL